MLSIDPKNLSQICILPERRFHTLQCTKPNVSRLRMRCKAGIASWLDSCEKLLAAENFCRKWKPLLSIMLWRIGNWWNDWPDEWNILPTSDQIEGSFKLCFEDARDYMYSKCSLCGRVGNGSCQIRDVHVGPICTGDEAVKSCRDLITGDKLNTHQILAKAFEKVVGKEFNQKYPCLAWEVVQFIRNCSVGPLPSWSLKCVSLGGENLISIKVQPTTLGYALHEIIADRLGIRPYTFQLLHGIRPYTSLLQATISLQYQDVNDNALFHLVELAEPVRHDGIHRCDSCMFQRFCHYGYSSYGDDEPEFVLALCEPCGGRRDDLSSTDINVD